MQAQSLYIKKTKTMTDTENLPDGILIVRKDAGMTSADVVNRIKRIPGVKKAGHTGTLDPFATGVMVCPVNRATKLARFFLHGRKTYRARLCLGIETDTQDHTGRIICQKNTESVTPEKVESAIQSFTGEIEQVPPSFSALKHKGIPLYKYAREGKPITKPPRRVKIYDIKVININLPEVEFEVTCSSGTYVRTLCADIGKALGCGGHLCHLERTKSNSFTIEQAIDLSLLEAIKLSHELTDFLIPMAEALPEYPSVTANRFIAEKIRFGRQLNTSDIGRVDTAGMPVKVIDEAGRLIAIVEPSPEKITYKYCCVFPY